MIHKDTAMKITGFFVLTAAMACAQGGQNIDLTFMLGAVGSRGAVASTIPSGPSLTTIATPGSVTVTGSSGFAMEIGFGYQVATLSKGSLYLEIPLISVWHFNGDVMSAESSGSVMSLNRNSWYLLPGVRWKIPTGSRVSFYAALGGGPLIFHQQNTLITDQSESITSNTGVKPVLDFGVGMDLRVSRWLSLRVDTRDYVHSPVLGSGAVNNFAVLAGVAFHF
jgi:hypothetical protein